MTLWLRYTEASVIPMRVVSLALIPLPILVSFSCLVFLVDALNDTVPKIPTVVSSYCKNPTV
jgi:hypothetical protein